MRAFTREEIQGLLQKTFEDERDNQLKLLVIYLDKPDSTLAGAKHIHGKVVGASNVLLKLTNELKTLDGEDESDE